MSTNLPLADELAAVFLRMSKLLLSTETVHTALDLVVSLASETVPGTLGAGITLLDTETGTSTKAASNPLVEQADAVQYELDEGPCLESGTNHAVVRITDTSSEARWPRWCKAAAALGIRASLSAPLLAGEQSLGAIKMYAAEPDVFAERDEYLLTMLAAQAAILLANVRSYESAQRLSEELKNALRSRDLINVAKGILMEREGAGEEAAFALIVGTSQQQNNSVYAAAKALVHPPTRRRH